MMADKIVGLKELGESLQQAAKGLPADAWIDLDSFPLSGVEKVDRHTWRIRIKGKYPQFAYWLAMPFFAPVPREVERFFAQPGMAAKNLTLDWWPVGTGPYMLSKTIRIAAWCCRAIPIFTARPIPAKAKRATGAGLLADCGKPLPFIDQAVFTREKEAIPYWNKFLQGYYDASGISSDSFDQAVRVNVGGDVALTDEMRDKGIRLLTSVKTSTFYMGFNMLDRWSAASTSGRPSCARRSRSPSTRKSSSPSSRTGAALPRRARCRRAFRLRGWRNRDQSGGHDWAMASAAQADCAGQATDGRGRLSERPP
jgi:hypothetical protein